MTVKLRFNTLAEATAFLKGISYADNKAVIYLGMQFTEDYHEVWLKDDRTENKED
jgi:hypothetical protein